VDNAYQLVKEKYDWKIVMPRFLDLVESVANTRAKERDDNIGGFNY
jgi:hypothetical protein